MAELEKWLQLFKNVLSYNAVQGGEKAYYGGKACWPRFIEHYLKGWFQVELRIRGYTSGQCEARDYRLTFRTPDVHILPYAREVGLVVANHQPWLESDMGGHSRQDGSAMLVAVPQVIQNPKQASILFPSLIGLDILDDGSEFVRQLFQVLARLAIPPCITTAKWEPRFSFRNWKRDAFRGSDALADRPNGVIQYGTQVVDNICDTEANLRRDLAPLLGFDMYHDLACRVLLYLDDNFAWSTIKEDTHLVLQVEDMLFRPLEPEIEGVVCFSHERQEARNSKNTQGSRDSSTYQGRGAARPREGGEAQAVTDSQPEEVATQTGLSRRRGGYSAKRIRSGIPEDA